MLFDRLAARYWIYDLIVPSCGERKLGKVMAALSLQRNCIILEQFEI